MNAERSGRADQVVNVSTIPTGSISRRAPGVGAAPSPRRRSRCRRRTPRGTAAHAEAVARQEQLAASRRSQIANAKSPFKRSRQSAPHCSYACAITSVSRRRREAMAEPLELVAQLDVVVDLAVLHHPVAAGSSLRAAGRRPRGRRSRAGCSPSRSARRGRAPLPSGPRWRSSPAIVSRERVDGRAVDAA